MTERILTLRELNRALLARHMLLERVELPVLATIEKLAGMQAQIPRAPYVGLWTRLKDFRREALADLITERKVVKATLMRGTLHFLTTDDYVRHRTTLHPALNHFVKVVTRENRYDIDFDAMLETIRRYIDEEPRSFKEIGAKLAELYPDQGVDGLRNIVRVTLPLVQVPTDTRWSYPGSPRFALAESWIDRKLAPEGDLRDFAFRYLSAFGPASVKDMQTWSGMSGLKEAFENWRDELKVYRDENGRELFDLPDAPLPDADTPAPVRFIPELDNLLIGHDERSRVIKYEYRFPVMKINGQGSITFLVDGFVRGVAVIEKTKQAAALVIEPFEQVGKKDRAALVEEGEKLIRFIEPEVKAYEVRFKDA